MDRLRRFLLKLRGEVCYWICEHLDDMVARPTTGTKMIVGDAISVSELLDFERVLDQAPHLPQPIIQALGRFSREDWTEVLAFANLTDMQITRCLKDPEWKHLRNTRVTFSDET